MRNVVAWTEGVSTYDFLTVNVLSNAIYKIRMSKRVINGVHIYSRNIPFVKIIFWSYQLR